MNLTSHAFVLRGDVSHFIFGYGSLISDASCATSGPIGQAIPARATNFIRGLNIQSIHHKYTGVGIHAEPGAIVNGVLVSIYPESIFRFDLRELVHDYAKVRISNSWISSVSQPGFELSDDDYVWAYVVNRPVAASAEIPTAQSYVDICLTGCLQIDERFRLQQSFAEEFVRSTIGWSFPWIDDRSNPRCVDPSNDPSKYIDIDAVLSKVVPNEFANRIRLSRPTGHSDGGEGM